MEIIKPTQEKKKKVVTSKRAQELIRRRQSVLTLTATARRKSLAAQGDVQVRDRRENTRFIFHPPARLG